MESKKIVLLAVAVVAIGIFALPGTVSLFSGQHSWYDLGGGANDVPCEKCHQDIEDEMQSGDNGAHGNLSCMCHRTIFTNYSYATVNREVFNPPMGTVPGEEAHAASTVECMHCHGIKGEGAWNHWSYAEYGGRCDDCHWSGDWTDFISAGGFGFDTTEDDLDTGERAAHKKFVLDAMNESLMEGANEACIACHTRIGVNITWTKKVHMDFTAIENETGVWTIPEFTAGGENVTQVNTSNSWTNP